MQLYAIDASGKIISAFLATKQNNYSCIECDQVVRVRGGSHRHTHFFHLAPISNCALHAKSMAHLQTQLQIQSQLPDGESKLEHRFPEINRIADVAWLPQKIVFEIQCSPITVDEVQARDKAYASAGFQVVWILHDARYNAPILTPVEHYLEKSKSPCYFTNIDASRKGMIYDQFSLIKKNVRKKTLSPLPVSLSEYREMPHETSQALVALEKRVNRWPIYFTGDLIDISKNDDFQSQEYLQEAKRLEEMHYLRPVSYRWWMWPGVVLEKFLLRPYRLLFQVILEGFCK